MKNLNVFCIFRLDINNTIMAKLFNKRSSGQRNRRAKEGFIKWFLSTWVGRIFGFAFWALVLYIAYMVITDA